MTGEGRRGRPERRGRGWLVLYVLLLAVVFVPAVTLTSMRLLQPDGSRGAVIVSLTPLGVVLYGLLGLLALAGFVGRRRAMRAVPASVALLVALGGLWVHGSWLWPSFEGDRPAPAAGARPFGVLSINLERGTGDPADVVAAARRLRPAVVVLVEITPRALDALDQAGFAQTYPHRAGDALPEVGGTMILSSGPLSEEQALGTAHGSWAATAALPQGSFRVWAVHPRRPAEGGTGWRDDYSALQTDLRRTTPPDIVAGDFNATGDHGRFQDLLEGGLRDSAEMVNAGWAPTWPANGDFWHLPRFVEIDHVLVGPSLTALSTRRVHVATTDHSGVFARLAAR